jgi:hypothetical protein
VKRGSSDFFQAIWQENIYKRRTAGKRITGDFGYSIRQHDAGQATATFECKGANTHHAVRHRNVRQIATTRERSLPDVFDTVRYRDAHQAIAIPESRITDSCLTIGERDLFSDTIFVYDIHKHTMSFLHFTLCDGKYALGV